MTTYYYFAKPYGAKMLTLFRIEGTPYGKDRIKVARRAPGLGFAALISPRDLHDSPEAALKAARVVANREVEKATARLAEVQAALAALPETPGEAAEEA